LLSRRHKILLVLIVLVLLELLAWIAARALVVDSDLPQAEVLVVLGGSANYLERAQAAAQIFKAGRVKKIVLTNDGQPSGWSNSEERNPLFVERARSELQRQGVPTASIETLPEIVNSTRDEALLLRKTAVESHWLSLLVLTSPYHSRRALWTFRHEFRDSGVVLGLTFVRNGQQTPSPWFWWLTPSGWRQVAGEYAKFVHYRLIDRG